MKKSELKKMIRETLNEVAIDGKVATTFISAKTDMEAAMLSAGVDRATVIKFDKAMKLALKIYQSAKGTK